MRKSYQAAMEERLRLSGEQQGPPVGPIETPAAPAAPTKPYSEELVAAIRASSQRLGINPSDLATAISYETAGTMDPWKAGPTTKWGQHRGLIQWGEPQRKKYGVYEGMPVADQMGAVEKYLIDAGVKPGMGLLDTYSAINAGRVGLYNRSDAHAGGAPGTVADKVATQMVGHRMKAQNLLDGKWSPTFSSARTSTPPLATPAVTPVLATGPEGSSPTGGTPAQSLLPPTAQAAVGPEAPPIAAFGAAPGGPADGIANPALAALQLAQKAQEEPATPEIQPLQPIAAPEQIKIRQAKIIQAALARQAMQQAS